MDEVNQKAFSLDELCAFTGSQKFFRYPMSDLVFTQGIRYLMERTQSDWLLTDIAYQHLPQVLLLHPDTFYRVTFMANADSSAIFCFEDGNGAVLYTHRYPYTDFPVLEETLRLFVCLWPEHQFCLMVPSEY